MSYLRKMAWRNLGRNRWRTFLSLLAVATGVFIILLIKGFVDGFIGDMLNNNISLNSGHVRIFRPEYEAKERLLSLGYTLGEAGPTYARLIGGIRRLPGVRYAMGRIRFGLMLVADDRQEAVMGLAIEPAVEESATRLDRFMQGEEAGRLPRPGRQEILVGSKALAKLNLRVGEKVNAIFATSFGSFKIATFKIAGQLKSGIGYIDQSLAYVPLDTAMSLLELDDAVTEIVVFGREEGQAAGLERVVDRYLRDQGLSLKVVPWDKYNELIAYIAKARVIYDLIYAFITVLASFIVFNTLMMVVAERTKEIGMLTALGLPPGETKKLFLWEGAFVAGFGSLLGATCGGIGNSVLSHVGLDISKMTAAFGGKSFMMAPKMYTAFRLSDLVFAFLLGTAITILAAYLPARRAARIEPTEALRTI